MRWNACLTFLESSQDAGSMQLIESRLWFLDSAIVQDLNLLTDINRRAIEGLSP